jgi:hypothetical protein
MSSINIDHHIFHFGVIFLFEGVVTFCKKNNNNDDAHNTFIFESHWFFYT